MRDHTRVHLNTLDGVRKQCLRNIDVSKTGALQSFNLAPLSTRRDITNLGIIYRAVLVKDLGNCKLYFVLMPGSVAPHRDGKYINIRFWMKHVA